MVRSEAPPQGHAKIGSRVAREIAEMATAQRRVGIMDEAIYQKIMARHLGEKAPPIEARE